MRAVFVAQAILDVLSCLLLGRLAARAAGPRAGLATLALASVYPFTAHAVGTHSPETLLVFLGLLFVALVAAWPERGGWLPLLAAGLCSAALCWVKPVFLPVPAFLLLGERLRGRTWGTSALRAGVVLGVTGAAFLPWVIRNQRAFGRPVLGGETGIVVWHGTRDFDADTPTSIKENFEISAAAGEERYSRTQAGLADSRAVLAQDAKYLEMGLERIRARPLDAVLWKPLRRLPRLWISSSHAQMPAWVGWVAAAASVTFLALGAAGLWIARGSLRALAAWWVLPVALTLAYAALHAEARYTLPARPSLLLLGGIALAAFTARRDPRPGA